VGVLKATALMLSVLVNIALSALWLSAVHREVAVLEVAPPRTRVATVTATDGDFARWLALGLDRHEAKRLLFATVEASAVAAIQSPWERYWQPGDPAAEYASALQEAYGRVRRELERELGAEAPASSEFHRAFRPLDAQFAFLSGPEQIELQQRRLRARNRSVPMAAMAAATEHSVAATSAGVSLDFLAPPAAFEVTLRDSPRAEQLRSSGVELEEHEFRETFALLEQADVAGDLAAQAATQQRLRTLLGAQRFAAVAAVRDPLFAIVTRVAREHGLDRVASTAAYEVLSDAQGQLLDLAAARIDGERAATAAATIAAKERERLDAAVGETVAAAIRAAREEFYVGAGRGGGSRAGTGAVNEASQ
jgi:hypothetical protein